ncbi:bifunctional indole-3-glycerol-phosphate synthase TrpC/phosphoribosylanthranilate isomerase TrpF [Sphingomonas sp. SM33]|uniref:N-(5'-phosphoribosyl)anthranilate isomerase n=1 Tax=Sphingomonas telluris TaxID=2907998 RepID=A0ABS9VN14_9SPHN|nr:bifunctional indole-3-glycerol-phosphate synthase TrpC/phosphoribosylanthranilate isomerase TrpF [Sphingomonas telluris]MCH8616098.1 bifunctional indole-3-glycerol-phosphate synthase TrpC/phosphoribosylanthranilate isomerase TrpF [Sphingomonas telluris]
MAEGVLAEIAERKRRDVADRLAGTSFDPEPTRRSLREALAKPGARFIMEVKKASPSGHRSSFSVEQAVAAYAPVADAISVLTDTPYFSGSLDDLRTVRGRFDGPILAKDFIVDPRQVAEARLHGADAALVIMAMLDDAAAAAVMAEAHRLAMDVIVEVHDELELHRALALGAQIIGINNRDLRTLKTDLAVTERLVTGVPDDRLVISESGVRDRRDVERLAKNVDAFLVGSSLMASSDVAHAARALVYGNIKICGLTSEDDASMAAGKATHAGLIFADASPREVTDRADVIANAARSAGAKPIGVFQDQDFDFVAGMANEIGLAAVQLHGEESDLHQLREKLPEDCEIWAVSAVTNEVSPERPGADRILYDTKANGRTGGTGQMFDWSLLAGRPELPDAFIAGGIGPANARDAQAVGAYGIDVCSGVEASPGRKDPEKVAALFEAARPACRRTA